jgi:beta-1,2-mannobiose phosphorylase / 1,2-beta-oligomannan phosphorylase
LQVTKHGVVLKKTDTAFDKAGVLNPAVLYENGVIHLFFRAVRKGNYSSIGYCKMKDPLTVGERFDKPILFPQTTPESHGIEDPRISKIDDVYYLTYTAYDGLNALGSYAVTGFLPYFEKKGIISPQITYSKFKHLTTSQEPLSEKYFRYNGHPHLKSSTDKKALIWDKNVVFFPRRIQGKLVMLHRIKPDIQIVAVTEMSELTPAFWENYFSTFNSHIALQSVHPHEASYVGGGCPPIETEAGWLLIYHGVYDTPDGYKYSACAALLDLEDPMKEIARLPYPLFSPDHDYEEVGTVNNVCFPTGSALIDGLLYIYYGAADDQVACASVNQAELVAELLTHRTEK